MAGKRQYEAIAKEMNSDSSPVGIIDVKKTQIFILQKLKRIEERLLRLEKKIL
ncbi:MAG: hypothetical protein HKN31_13720 [Pricia sp.]|nr:hypothetical protein [Pricia sp.]